MGKSWKLRNVVTGDSTMVRGQMDISIVEGSVEELTAPLDIVAQRIEKATVEPKGSNRFSPNWGSRAATLIGRKLVPAEVAREVGTDLRLMVDALIVEQSRVARAVPLDPAETIVRLGNVSVSVVDDTIGVTAHVVVGDGAGAIAKATVTR